MTRKSAPRDLGARQSALQPTVAVSVPVCQPAERSASRRARLLSPLIQLLSNGGKPLEDQVKTARKVPLVPVKVNRGTVQKIRIARSSHRWRSGVRPLPTPEGSVELDSREGRPHIALAHGAGLNLEPSSRRWGGSGNGCRQAIDAPAVRCAVPRALRIRTLRNLAHGPSIHRSGDFSPRLHPAR